MKCVWPSFFFKEKKKLNLSQAKHYLNILVKETYNKGRRDINVNCTCLNITIIDIINL